MSVTDIEEKARQIGNGVAKDVPEKTARIRQTLEDGAKRGAKMAREQTAAVGRRVSQTTQEHPLASVSSALGVGLAAGVILGFCLAQAFRD